MDRGRARRLAALLTGGIGLAIAVAVAGPGPVGPAETAARSIVRTRPAVDHRPIVAVDPGHGGSEPGAVHRGPGGRIDVIEKEVNLAIGLRLEELLIERGFDPVLTRRTDTRINIPAHDRNGDGAIDTDDDLQARVDLANDAGAAILLSIHNNGLANARVRGTMTFYCADHPHGPASRTLAALLQSAFVARLAEAGYTDVIDSGYHDDGNLGKPYGHLFLIGPKTPRVARPAEMPGVIGESLFVSNDREAALLRDDAVIDAIAAAYADAVSGYFGDPGAAAE